ncbi:hypothetical protein Ancab_034200 [Ancistrocladus abbreviatus]
MGSVIEILLQKAISFFLGIWHPVSSFLFILFGFINKGLSRFVERYGSRRMNSHCSTHLHKVEAEPEAEFCALESKDSSYYESEEDGEKKEDEPKSFLSFRFQTYEEFVRRVPGNNNNNNNNSVNADSNENYFEAEETVDSESLCEEDTQEIISEAEDLDGALNRNPENNRLEKEVSEYSEEVMVEGISLEQFDGDEITVSSDSDSESMISSSKLSLRSSLLDSISDDQLSSDSEFEDNSLPDFDGQKVKSTEESENLYMGYESDHQEDVEISKELQNLETKNWNLEFEFNVESKEEDFSGNDEKPISEKPLDSDYEDSNGLETLWEHQDLVEQLKMEIRKVRATGLPTILEESETPKIMDDLKPWKIEDKFQHEGTIHEVHKFYKSYRERMRKFDIFNYQKMYAIGFLRLKDPLEPFSIEKNSAAAITAIVGQDCWPCKPKAISESHPMIKFSRELESDLEMVYVGQLCLSWEFLHWEYGKALDLWDSDLHGMRCYNEVAGEFQEFQVLIQRFLEDEPFQGPRVQNYVKNRCVHRHLLQVPVIREDSLKDRKRERSMGKGKDAITSVMLVEIIEECIRLFWQFVRADKDSDITTLKCCRRGSNLQLQNPADAELLLEVQSNLAKKQKKLKQLLRSDSCRLLRVFNKHQRDESGIRVVYFFCQVDLKLVSRVLNMSKLTTDQLLWCSNKLDNVKFFHRRVHVEPSFLLFPCP